jgi:hypothetical protein
VVEESSYERGGAEMTLTAGVLIPALSLLLGLASAALCPSSSQLQSSTDTTGEQETERACSRKLLYNYIPPAGDV